MNKWTSAQEAAITETSPKILVSAAAGSGKTSVMIERVARLICGGESIENMAICTFTKRAAQDMRLKLTLRLKELASENVFAERALKGLAQSDISTLHSWCSKLIKTYFYAVDVDPNFEIMPEAAQKTEKSRAIEKVIESEKEQGETVFLELYDILRSSRRHDALVKLVRRIFDQAVALPSPIEFLEGCLEQKLHDDYYIAKLTEQKELSCEPYSGEEKTLRHVAVLVRLVKAVIKEYALVKAKKAWLDYSDLEQLALKLLKSEYAQLVKAKYKYIFIDEYQDINPLQEELLKLDTNMFYVGDVKQSIYGFRMCAPQFFIAKREDYIKNNTGKALELNKNWRSDNKILQFVNKIFSRIMTKDFGEVDYIHDASFEAGSDIYESSVVINLVKLQEKVAEQEEEKIYSVINHDYQSEDFKAEQKLVLQHILQLITTTIKEGNSVRAVKFSDIAILVRSRDAYTKSLMTLLKSAGIDCSFTDATSIDEQRYIEYLINYLKLIDNSRDDISMASVMLEFGGFSEQELAQIRIFAGDNCSFTDAVNLYAESSGGEKVKEFLQTLKNYRVKSGAVDANYLIQTIVSDYDYFKTVYANAGEEGAEALAEMLDSVENSPYKHSLYEFLQSLDVEADLAVGEKSNSVKIMTIHASKGLEFPFVILPNIAKRIDMRDLTEKMLLSERGIALSYFNYFNHTAQDTPKMALERVMLKKKLLEEEMRIFYVALTRPIFQLALFGSYSKNLEAVKPKDATSYLDWLGDAGEEYCLVIEESECLSDLSLPEPKIIFKKPNLELVKKIKERLDFKSQEEHLLVKTNVSKILSESDSQEKVVYSTCVLGDDKALERGVAYHKIMELINFDTPFEAEWARLIKVYPTAKELVEKSKIERASIMVGELVRGAKIYREQPFVYNEKGLIQGVLDLLIIRGNSAIIVDYKTTKKEDLLSGNYAEQLAIYSRATEKILGVRVEKKLLYSFDKGDFVAV